MTEEQIYAEIQRRLTTKNKKPHMKVFLAVLVFSGIILLTAVAR